MAWRPSGERGHEESKLLSSLVFRLAASSVSWNMKGFGLGVGGHEGLGDPTVLRNPCFAPGCVVMRRELHVK